MLAIIGNRRISDIGREATAPRAWPPNRTASKMGYASGSSGSRQRIGSGQGHEVAAG